MLESVRVRARTYQQQLNDNFLVDGNAVVEGLRANGTLSTRYETDRRTGVRYAILRSGIRVAEYDYLIMPDVYLRQILRDYWDLFEMTILDLNSPGATFMARTLYEASYKNLLQYVHATSADRRIIALKSWMCTSGLLARTPSNPSHLDPKSARDYDQWLSRLHGHPDYGTFAQIKANGFSNIDINIHMGKVFPKSFQKCVDRYSSDLIKPDGQPIDMQVLKIIYNFLNGYVHAQPAHLANLKGDYGVLGTLGRLRTFLLFSAYQVLYLPNQQLPQSQQLSLAKQATYYRRIAPHVIRRTQPRP